MYTLKYKPSVKKDLKKVDKSKIEEIRNEIGKLKHGIENNPENIDVIKMKGNNPFYRLKFDCYRVIFTIDNEKIVITVIKVGHRKDIYKKLDRL